MAATNQSIPLSYTEAGRPFPHLDGLINHLPRAVTHLPCKRYLSLSSLQQLVVLHREDSSRPFWFFWEGSCGKCHSRPPVANASNAQETECPCGHGECCVVLTNFRIRLRGTTSKSRLLQPCPTYVVAWLRWHDLTLVPIRELINLCVTPLQLPPETVR